MAQSRFQQLLASSGRQLAPSRFDTEKKEKKNEGFFKKKAGALNVSTVEGLEELATKQEFEPPKRQKVLSALRKVGGILNVGAATTAGAVRGAIREDISVAEGAKQGFKDRETFGFGDIIREDLGIKPETKGGKFAVGATGFVADIIFDPITYLTLGLGSGLKIGSKTLTRGGTKLAQAAGKEVTQSMTDNFIKKGLSLEAASKMASRKATPLVNDLVQRTFGKKGITDSAAREFMDKGVSQGTIHELSQLGANIIDRGGIKMFGRTLVQSKTLKNTPIGQAARRIFVGKDGALTGVGEKAQFLKETLGKTFIADFGKNPKLINLISKASRAQKNAVQGIIKTNEELFKGLSDKQMTEFFNTVFKKKLQIVSSTKEIQEKTIKDLNKRFPELKIKNPEKASSLLSSLEKLTQRKTFTLNKVFERFSKKAEFLKEKRAVKLEKGKEVAEKIITEKTAKKTGVLQDRLNKTLEKEINLFTGDLKSVAMALRKGMDNDVMKVLETSGEVVSKQEFDDIISSVVNPLRDEMELLIKELEQESRAGIGKEFLNKPLLGIAKLTKEQLAKKTQKEITGIQNKQTDLINKAEREINKKIDEVRKKAFDRISGKSKEINSKIIKLQNELSDKGSSLQRIMGASREVKGVQKGEKIAFDDKKLQEVSDKLFEGDDAIVKRFAKTAEIPEEEAIKFYIPSKFKDKITIKDFAVGKNLTSPNLGFKKKFTGVENEQLIRNPFEAFSRGQIDVVTARIKDRAFKNVIGNLGSAVEKEGFEKVTRKGLDGKTVEGFFPKEMADELKKFLEPKSKGIDDLAKTIGFDWATGLFKGYVTLLFPAFHLRNITSNQVQNMLKIGLDVLNPKIQANAARIVAGKNLDKVLTTKTGKKITLGQVRKQIQKESDVLSQTGAFGKLEQFIDESNKKIIRKGGLKRFNPLSQENLALKAGRKVGEASEAQAKVVAVLSEMMQGKTAKEGIKTAEEALFNYSKLTDFERSVMRRIIPFYTFGRKNFELQLKALTKTPGKVASQLKFFRGLSDAIGEPVTEEDLDSMAPWVLEGLGIKAGTDEHGNGLFFSGFGLPIEEFLSRFSGEGGIVTNAFKNVLEQSNPLLKFPTERATGVDFFRGKPITEVTNGQNLKAMIDAMPPKVAEQFKEMVEFKELKKRKFVKGEDVGETVKYTADPFALHLMRNLPTARITGTIGQVTNEEEAKINKLLRFFTGVKGWSIDKENQQFFNDLDRQRELQDWLIRMGAIKKFERAFEPKEESKGFFKKKG